jgi:hypothetical protein
MSTAKTILSVAAAAVILAGAFGVYQLNERRSAEATIAATAERVQATVAKLRSAEDANSALTRDNAELQTKLAAQAAAPRSAVAPAATVQRAPEARGRDSAHAADLVMLRFQSAAQPLFERWGIGPEKSAEALRLVSEPARIKRDAVELAKAELRNGNWSRENDAKLGETIKRATQETMQKLEDLIGRDRVQELMKLGGALGEHELAARVAGDLAFTDAPLSAASGEALVQILQQTKYAPANYQNTPIGGTMVTAEAAAAGKALLNEEGLGTLPLITDAAMEKASGMLTPAQVAALRRLQAQQLAVIKMGEGANAVAGR